MSITLNGNINANGKKGPGSSGGFSSRRESTGTYFIDFAHDFSNIPTVVATLTGGGPGTTQSDNIINIKTAKNNCTVYVLDQPDGVVQDGAFNFIAIGTLAD